MISWVNTYIRSTLTHDHLTTLGSHKADAYDGRRVDLHLRRETDFLCWRSSRELLWLAENEVAYCYRNGISWTGAVNAVAAVVASVTLDRLFVKSEYSATCCRQVPRLHPLVRKTQVHYRVHNSPPLMPIVRQMNPVHTSHSLSL